MTKIEFSREQQQVMVQKLQSYFDQELNQELEQFDAEFLLDFFCERYGRIFL